MVDFSNPDNFKQSFKSVAFHLRAEIVNELATSFDLPHLHHARYALALYYCKYPKLTFDNNLAKGILNKYFEKGSFFVLDYREASFGGYLQGYFKDIVFCDTHISTFHPKELSIADANWKEFVEQMTFDYWDDNVKLSFFKTALAPNIFEDRLPETKMEILLHNMETIVEGKTIKGSDYKFFNEKSVAIIYDRLIEWCFPDFSFSKGLSSKLIRRYTKPFNDEWNLVVCVDYSAAFKEFARTYLQMPKIHIELIRANFSGFVAEKEYIKNQENYPIYRFGLHYSLGAPNIFEKRIGNSSMDEEYLKRQTMFLMDVRSLYLNKYVSLIEMVLGKV